MIGFAKPEDHIVSQWIKEYAREPTGNRHERRRAMRLKGVRP